MKRFFLVQANTNAQDGRVLLVADPHNSHIANPPRFVGVKIRYPLPSHEDSIGLVDNYELSEQVIADHPDIRRAIDKKMLIHLAGPVIARDADAARELLTRPTTRPSTDKTPRSSKVA